MKQVLQNLGTGETLLAEVPCPAVKPGHLLVRTGVSLLSTGTERMLIDFARANLINKARRQPDKIRMVLEKIRSDGLFAAVDAVRSKLDQPLPLGYSNAGVVVEVGRGVTGFKPGDRVVSNGPHAEIVCVPKNLCAAIPDNVTLEEAAFTVIGSIGLQGIRLLGPSLGEAVAVTGLGLIGLICVQLLKAHGCRVLGIDLDQKKCELARRLGAEAVDLSKGEDPVAAGVAFSRGRGMDAVVITAATKSSKPVHHAANMCRKRGRIVLVGVTGLELSRADFYEKELSFQVSCSYGPGRYDPDYEIKGHDYPFGFVRWTEQRNFEAFMDTLSTGGINVEEMISHRFPFEKALDAYEVMSKERNSLGIMLEYDKSRSEETEERLLKRTAVLSGPVPAGRKSREVVVGFIGAGNYASRVLIPAFKNAGAVLGSVASSGGVSGTHSGGKFGFLQSTTDTQSLIKDPRINAVVVSTRHDSHAALVCRALESGKHVFVEKPLALNTEQIADIESAYSSLVKSDNKAPVIMVGFNRRFAPHIIKIKSMIEAVREPKIFIMTVNAGFIPKDHWTQDPAVGGGRIIGEACHFVDLLRYLAATPVTSTQSMTMGESPGVDMPEDKVTFTLGFADGSLGTVHYLANGHRAFPKERLEVFCAGKILHLDNFRSLRGYGWPGFKKMKLWRQDKGQNACVEAFLESITAGGPPPVPFEEIIEVSRITVEVSRSLKPAKA